MGKIYDSLLSGTSGRTGRIVVANVFGNEYSRVRPKKRTSVPTAKQQLIRLRMQETVRFMQSYRTYACNYFGRRVDARSCYNLAMTNVLNSFEIDYTNQTVTPNYPLIEFSRGKLLSPVPIGLQLPTATTLEVTWQDNSGADPLSQTDQAQILIAAEGQLITQFAENVAPRSAGKYTANLLSNLQGKTLHVYIAFRAADGSAASNSLYVGSIS